MEEIKDIDDLVAKVSSVPLPWADCCTPEITHWLDVFSRAHGTRKELVFPGMLATVGALLGKTELKLFSTHKERANIFFIGLAPSGSGKTPAAQISCSHPIVNYLEPKIGDGKQLLIDNSSCSGLFNYFLNEKTVPVMCIDECQGFIHKMIYPSKGANDQSLTMERMCKLYDGDAWYSVRGSKGKRSGTQFAAVSLIAFTTPKMFLKKVWGKAVENKNGFADRFMLYCCDREDVSIEDKETFSERLDEFAVTSLDIVYEKIYAEHNTPDRVEYKLNQSAKECYLKFTRPNPESSAEKSDAKVRKNVLKLALILHVFYDCLRKALDFSVGATPRIINEETMKMAISLCSTLSHVKALMDLSATIKDGERPIKTGTSADEIKQRILGETADMFTTAKRVYTSFSSIRRPSPAFVMEQFQALENEGLGVVRNIHRSTVFFKKVPETFHHEEYKLGKHNITFQVYKQMFETTDAFYDDDQRMDLVRRYPWTEDAQRFNYIQVCEANE